MVTLSDSRWERHELAAARINAKTNVIQAYIGSVEERLKETSLGVSVWIPLLGSAEVADRADWPQEEKDRVWSKFQTYTLGYCRIGSSWHLAIRRGYGRVVDNEDVAEPLANAERLVRALAATRIDALLTEMEEKAELVLRTLAEVKDIIAKEWE